MLRAVSRVVALAAIASLVACNGGGGASSSLLPSQPSTPELSPANGSPSFGAPAARPICPPTHNLNQMRCYAWMRTDIVPDLSTTHGVPSNAGFTASDIESAYNLNVTKGAGQTVAIVDAFGYTQAAKDLAVYRSASGLPACTTATGCFTILNQKGQKKPLPKPNPNTQDDWRPEQALDLDAVSAACPKCHIVLVQANSDYNSDLYTAEQAAAEHSHIISNSFGGPEGGGATNPAFDYPNTMIVASAGDDGGGTSTGGAAMPCAYATVVCVGGTALTQGGGTRGWSEVAWNDLKTQQCNGPCGATGSGCSKIVAKPSWQTDTASGGCTMRSESDVSASASPLHPFAIYISTSGGWNGYGGTSLSSPLIAGVFGLSGNASSRHSAQELWGAKSGFNDVTSGTNFYKPVGGKCASKVKYICTAGPGYDGPTGLGTPSGTSAF